MTSQGMAGRTGRRRATDFVYGTSCGRQEICFTFVEFDDYGSWQLTQPHKRFCLPCNPGSVLLVKNYVNDGAREVHWYDGSLLRCGDAHGHVDMNHPKAWESSSVVHICVMQHTERCFTQRDVERPVRQMIFGLPDIQRNAVVASRMQRANDLRHGNHAP